MRTGAQQPTAGSDTTLDTLGFGFVCFVLIGVLTRGSTYVCSADLFKSIRFVLNIVCTFNNFEIIPGVV